MATISESMRAAERLNDFQTLREEVTSGLHHAAPMLDAWADATTCACDCLRIDADLVTVLAGHPA
jgi:hypothetical protein